MTLRYQGALYEYCLSQIKAVPQSGLRYRGIFYSREIHLLTIHQK